jgi:hypothetical protein
VACIYSDKAGLDCSHGLESSSFEFHDVAAMSSCAFSINLFLTFHDRFNNLVSFFFCATSVDIDAL